MSEAAPQPPRLRRALPGLALIVVGLILVVVFGLRVLGDFRQMRQQGHAPVDATSESIRGWMTIPYIAHAYGVPEQTLFDALGIPAAENHDLALRQLARKYQRDATELRQVVAQAIRTAHGTPAPGMSP